MGELIALPVNVGGEVISLETALDKRRRAHARSRYAATLLSSCPEQRSAVARYLLEVEAYFETGRPPAAFGWR
jgi:hypothetical protein